MVRDTRRECALSSQVALTRMQDLGALQFATWRGSVLPAMHMAAERSSMLAQGRERGAEMPGGLGRGARAWSPTCRGVSLEVLFLFVCLV